MSTSLCGNKKPCANYFSLNPFNVSLSKLFEWTFQVYTGYNKLILQQPAFVTRGSFIYLTQLTSKIALDTSTAALYSDLVWSDTVWSRLNEYNDWRLFISTINNFTSYQNTFGILHAYATVGTYNILLTFTGSNQVFNQTIIVTDSMFYFTICIIFSYN